MKRNLSLLAFGLSAMTTASALGATLVHAYDFNGNLTDNLGGPDLIGNGGSLTMFGYYAFAANQGPTFVGAASLSDSYTIGLRFSFDEISSWRKIVDYKQRTSDVGLYNFSGALQFYPITSVGTFPQNTFVDVVISRDGITDEVTAYIEGQPALSFTDSGGLAVADIVFGESVFTFLQDDFAVGPHESSGGVLDRLVIYQGVVAEEDIPTAVDVPEGKTTGAMVAVMMAAAVGRTWRRRQ